MDQGGPHGEDHTGFDIWGPHHEPRRPQRDGVGAGSEFGAQYTPGGEHRPHALAIIARDATGNITRAPESPRCGGGDGDGGEYIEVIIYAQGGGGGWGRLTVGDITIYHHTSNDRHQTNYDDHNSTIGAGRPSMIG